MYTGVVTVYKNIRLHVPDGADAPDAGTNCSEENAMSTAQIFVEVNGVKASYEVRELEERYDDQLMIIAFRLLEGETPEFAVGDSVDLSYRMLGADWKTSAAKVVVMEEDIFKVHIEFKDLLRRFLSMEDMIPGGIPDGFVATVYDDNLSM